MLYFLGLGFIVTGVFLAARSGVALSYLMSGHIDDSPALYIVQGMFGLSMFLFGFVLRHRDVFEPQLADDLTPAPTPASAATPPRTKRPGRNPGRR